MTEDTRIGRGRAGLVRVTGADRFDLLNRLSTNDLGGLEPGRVISTIFTTNKGRVVDWVWVIARDDDLVVRTSVGRGARVRDWIDTYTIAEDVQASVLGETELIVVQGPAAARVSSVALEPGRAVIRGEVIWMAGLEAYGTRLEALAPAPADALVGELQAAGATPMDRGEIEVERISAGVPSAEREFESEVNPLELRLAEHAISFEKGCFVGQEVLARMDSYDKLARVLIGFDCAQPLPEDAPLELKRDGRPLGRITSVVNTGAGAVGLGVVKRTGAIDASDAEAQVGDTPVPVRLHDRPFWKSA